MHVPQSGIETAIWAHDLSSVAHFSEGPIFVVQRLLCSASLDRMTHMVEVACFFLGSVVSNTTSTSSLAETPALSWFWSSVCTLQCELFHHELWFPPQTINSHSVRWNLTKLFPKLHSAQLKLQEEKNWKAQKPWTFNYRVSSSPAVLYVNHLVLLPAYSVSSPKVIYILHVHDLLKLLQRNRSSNYWMCFIFEMHLGKLTRQQSAVIRVPSLNMSIPTVVSHLW